MPLHALPRRMIFIALPSGEHPVFGHVPRIASRCQEGIDFQVPGDVHHVPEFFGRQPIRLHHLGGFVALLPQGMLQDNVHHLMLEDEPQMVVGLPVDPFGIVDHRAAIHADCSTWNNLARPAQEIVGVERIGSQQRDNHSLDALVGGECLLRFHGVSLLPAYDAHGRADFILSMASSHTLYRIPYRS